MCGGGLAPPTQEVWNVLVGVDQAVLYYWHCFGLPLGFRWSVEISWRMGLLEEQDGAVVGVFLPVRSSEYINLRL